MVRTRIRGNQEQDIDFVSEAELNQFFGSVVITGTLAGDQENQDPTQDTEVVDVFTTYFPGQGLIIDQDGVTVTTGTNFVQISGTQLGVGEINTLSGSITLATGTNINFDTDVASNTITISSFTDDDVDSITTSGVTFTGSVNLATTGGSSLIADAGTNTITISGGANIGELVGNFFQVEFTGVGNINNTWLSVSSKDLASNITPWTVLLPCRIAGLSYSNANEDSNTDIEIYIADEGAGSTNTLEFTHEIRTARTAWKSDFGISEIQLQPGDKVALFARNAGNPKPKDLFLGLYLEVTARDERDEFENFTGDF